MGYDEDVQGEILVMVLGVGGVLVDVCVVWYVDFVCKYLIGGNGNIFVYRGVCVCNAVVYKGGDWDKGILERIHLDRQAVEVADLLSCFYIKLSFSLSESKQFLYNV